MARRPIDLGTSPVANAIRAAMRRLHDQGKEVLGPSDIGLEAKKDLGKEVPSTVCSNYLRRMVAAGEVERHALGSRRGMYRLSMDL